jgi:cell shape-determining protein MreC
MDIAIEILKWVLLILLAGFIGQFGKSLSIRVLHYFQDKRRKSNSPVAEVAGDAYRPVQPIARDPGQKAEKKCSRLKSSSVRKEKS